MPEENKHAKVTVPEATSYGLQGRWYVEIRVPHPTDPEMPPYAMTKDVNSQWWAQLLCEAINSFTDKQWEDFVNAEDRAEFNG